MATKLPSEPISGSVFPVIKGKPGVTVFQNPPFHPHVLNVGGANAVIRPKIANDFSVGTGNFHRGMIAGGEDIIPGVKGGIQYKINFLYNPSTIAESRGLDLNSGVLPAYKRNPDDPGSYATSLNTTVNFSLLFDRTFELWDSSYQDTLAGQFGVRVDVEAFYNLLGINTMDSSVTTRDNTGNKSAHVVQGPMTFTPVYLYFGNNSDNALSYFGYITEIDITYTHFAANMVPIRCAVNVTFTVLPNLTSTTS
jgi:hypothetical protein